METETSTVSKEEDSNLKVDSNTKKSDETESEKAKVETKQEEEETYTLARGKLISTYRCGSALLTVIISPFESQFFAKDSFTKHVKTCKTFEIRRIWNGVSAAQMRFATLEESEEAFLDLKNDLASMEVDVYHPSPRNNFNSVTLRNSEFSTLFDGTHDDEASFERFAMLDKLPEGTSDKQIAQLIPEAIEIVDLGCFDESKGCVAVVFNSKATCSEWLEKKGASFSVGEQKARAMTYASKERKAMELRRKLNAEKRKQQKEQPKTEEAAKPEPSSNELADDDRVAKAKEWNELLTSRNVLQDREDIVGYAKLREDKRLTDEMTQLAKLLLEDAKRRLGKNEKLPEPEDQMTAPVKKLMQQGLNASGDKKDASKSASKASAKDGAGDKDQKNEKSTPRNGGKSSSTPFRARAERGRGGVRGNFRGGRGGGNSRLSFLERMKSKTQGGPAGPRRDNVRPNRGSTSSYYDDAPSRKRPRMAGSFNSGQGNNYAMQSEMRGLTDMLSTKMRELERMQQQTLAVQNQLSQNMNTYGRSDSMAQQSSFTPQSSFNTGGYSASSSNVQYGYGNVPANRSVGSGVQSSWSNTSFSSGSSQSRTGGVGGNYGNRSGGNNRRPFSNPQRRRSGAYGGRGANNNRR